MHFKVMGLEGGAKILGSIFTLFWDSVALILGICFSGAMGCYFLDETRTNAP